MTELDIVNDILRATGAQPVNSLNSTHPHVTVIRTAIKRNVDRLQRRGFWFNTEYNNEFQPNSGRITLSNDISSIVPVDNNIVMRGRLLFDRIRNSVTFDSPVKVVSCVRILPLEDLPDAMQEAVKYAAAVEYTRDSIGDQHLIQSLKELAGAAMLAVLNEDLESEQLNAFRRPTVIKMRRGVRPYNLRGW